MSWRRPANWVSGSILVLNARSMFSGRDRRRAGVAEAGGATDCCSSALPPSSPGDALERSGTVRGVCISAQAPTASASGGKPSLRPVRSGREPKGYSIAAPFRGTSIRVCLVAHVQHASMSEFPKWTSHWRFWNDRFPPMPLKNSEIEPLRKSRFRARRVVSADSPHGKAYGRVAGGKAGQSAEPLRNLPSRLPAVF